MNDPQFPPLCVAEDQLPLVKLAAALFTTLRLRFTAAGALLSGDGRALAQVNATGFPEWREFGDTIMQAGAWLDGLATDRAALLAALERSETQRRAMAEAVESLDATAGLLTQRLLELAGALGPEKLAPFLEEWRAASPAALAAEPPGEFQDVTEADQGGDGLPPPEPPLGGLMGSEAEVSSPGDEPPARE